MKKLVFIFLLQLPLLILAQDKFNLKGEFSSVKEDKTIYLIHISDNQEKLDSTKLKGGKFEFNIPLSQASIALLLLDHTGNALSNRNPKDLLKFYIEPGNATLKATDSVSRANLSGLPIFKENEEFASKTKASEDKLRDLNIEFEALPQIQKTNDATITKFQDRYLGLINDRQLAIKEFIKKHPSSYISLYALHGDLINDDMNVPEIQSLFEGLSPKLKENSLAKSVEAKLDQAKITGLGVLVTDFEEKTPEGISVKLSSYKGQYVLLDFWASWCGPCRQESPALVSAYKKYKDKNFTILGVSIDKNSEAWKKAIKEDNLTWIQLLDTTKEIANTYGIDVIPKNFLIDPNGKIIAKNLRGPALEAKLKEVLGKL